MSTVVIVGSIRHGRIESMVNPNVFLRKNNGCLTHKECQHIFSRFSKEPVVRCNVLEQHMEHVHNCTHCQNNLKIVFTVEQQLLNIQKEKDLAALLDDESIHTSFHPPLKELTIYDGAPVYFIDEIIH